MKTRLLTGHDILAAAAVLRDGGLLGIPTETVYGLGANGLDPAADYALIDGNRDKGKHFALVTPHETVVKGDSRSASIAAASIVAKVSRDRVMEELAEKYPQYRFERHKGYGTRLHYEMLDKYGPSPVHRRSFLKKWEAARRG